MTYWHGRLVFTDLEPTINKASKIGLLELGTRADHICRLKVVLVLMFEERSSLK